MWLDFLIISANNIEYLTAKKKFHVVVEQAIATDKL